MFAYKHTETIEIVKNQPTFYEKYKFAGELLKISYN